MMEKSPVLRTIVQHASRDALAPSTGEMLSRLGYRILLPEDFDEMRESRPDLTPDLLLVDASSISGPVYAAVRNSGAMLQSEGDTWLIEANLEPCR